MGILELALLFLVIALIAGVFGFTGIVAGAQTVGRLLFGIFVVVFLTLLVLAAFGRTVLFG